ncbi:hypothetical protein GCM10022419_045560 [Nonomuraea rosea]|uniref:DUF721 domain-containing protein n=1 Tax=Nonomuraea rosea TaxID=638574 RepID=A0ABP6X145_9ACTN
MAATSSVVRQMHSDASFLGEFSGRVKSAFDGTGPLLLGDAWREVFRASRRVAALVVVRRRAGDLQIRRPERLREALSRPFVAVRLPPGSRIGLKMTVMV